MSWTKDDLYELDLKKKLEKELNKNTTIFIQESDFLTWKKTWKKVNKNTTIFIQESDF